MTPQNSRKLFIQGGVLSGMLVVEYLIGMYVNLFVQFPNDASTEQLWHFAWRQPFLVAHIILSVLLFVGSVVLLIRAIRYRSILWRTPSILGLLGVFLATLGGELFTSTQTDAYSYIMSIGFILALCSYGWGLMATRREIV
jgi:hypothetical protein